MMFFLSIKNGHSARTIRQNVALFNTAGITPLRMVLLYQTGRLWGESPRLTATLEADPERGRAEREHGGQCAERRKKKRESRAPNVRHDGFLAGVRGSKPAAPGGKPPRGPEYVQLGGPAHIHSVLHTRSAKTGAKLDPPHPLSISSGHRGRRHTETPPVKGTRTFPCVVLYISDTFRAFPITRCHDTTDST